jgi:YD repeat-containing protein
MRVAFRTFLTVAAASAVLATGVSFALATGGTYNPPPSSGSVYPCTPIDIAPKKGTSTGHTGGGSGGGTCIPQCPTATGGRATTSTYGGSYGGTPKTCRPPSVNTDCATWTDSASGKVTGSVNPNGAWTTYYFEYGKTTSFGSQTATGEAGNGRAVVGAEATISGLQPNTTYFYRLVATNEKGTTRSYTQSFKTDPVKPTVATGSASGIGRMAAMIGGTANPNGGATTAYLQVGRTTSFGSNTATQLLGNGSTAKSVSARLSGLSANTQYHFRIVATNAGGAATGATGSFTTSR